MSCETCPFVIFCGQKKAHALEIKEDAEDQYAELVMRTAVEPIREEKAQSLIDDLNHESAGIEIGPLGQKYRDLSDKLRTGRALFEQDLIDLIGVQQKAIDLHSDNITRAKETCNGRPRTRKRWWIFGGKVSRCTSPIAKNILLALPKQKK